MLATNARIANNDCESLRMPRRERGRPMNTHGASPNRGWAPMQGKYGHGLALTPQAETLTEAFLRLDGPAALRVLLIQSELGCSLDEIERTLLEPALTKVGELWLRGRVDDAWFDEFASFAESVERHFRRMLATPNLIA